MCDGWNKSVFVLFLFYFKCADLTDVNLRSVYALVDITTCE